MDNRNLSLKFRLIHRYLGFFLVGIIAVYSISGIALIFRKTNFFKVETIVTQQLDKNLANNQLKSKLRLKEDINKQEGDTLYFKNGTYNQATGVAIIKKMRSPYILGKMEDLHKSSTSSPIFIFNLFFGISLIFFVVSAFYMFLPSKPILKKGLYFTIGGIILTLIFLFI
ncbi:hypothetical protein [Tenacibaculum sp. UWU-22]|uniref:hypothetical protein n=1 Tax=Tenacibaculum sp. UWU-22 TaxID=3234187 RepID=UPI0034DB1B86